MSYGISILLSIKNAYPILSELRMIKSKDEIDEIRKAIAITEKGILNAMKNAKAGMREYEVEAYFDFVLKLMELRILLLRL